MLQIKVCKTEEEIQMLADLASHIWNHYFLGIITQKQIDYMVELFQSYPAISKAIHEDHYTYFTAYENGQMIGYCGVKPEENRLFLSKLYVHEDFRGKGYSSLLFQEALALAKQLGLHAVYLTCNKYNEHSLAVYKHKGFKVIDDVKTDIGSGFIMDDYVLQLDLI